MNCAADWKGRGTDAPEVIESRIAKAEYELSFAPQFDCVIVNDDLETAKAEALKVIKKFFGGLVNCLFARQKDTNEET